MHSYETALDRGLEYGMSAVDGSPLAKMQVMKLKARLMQAGENLRSASQED